LKLDLKKVGVTWFDSKVC